MNQEINKITQFIKQTFKKQGFQKAILALSGGLDSSVCLLLLCQALGPKNVLVLKMPYEKQNMADADKMLKLAKIPQKNIFLINILPVIKSLLQVTGHKLPVSNLRLGNLMPRTRMILTYDLAKAKKGLVCGTENKSEYLLGYFTLFGDQAADFSPIRHLYKTQVRNLGLYLGIPKKIIKKAPTASLWPGQTDEKELGFSYKEADQILSLLLEQKLPVNELFKKKIKKEVIKKVLARVKNNLYKHQIPYKIEV